mmetsp:Transcript_91279/g.241399  ORF Transcript_91279/g.241399 Transcript_91279/m.241399 type:complete len:265 (+) Transcript_91279:14-808(+)
MRHAPAARPRGAPRHRPPPSLHRLRLGLVRPPRRERPGAALRRHAGEGPPILPLVVLPRLEEREVRPRRAPAPAQRRRLGARRLRRHLRGLREAAWHPLRPAPALAARAVAHVPGRAEVHRALAALALAARRRLQHLADLAGESLLLRPQRHDEILCEASLLEGRQPLPGAAVGPLELPGQGLELRRGAAHAPAGRGAPRDPEHLPLRRGAGARGGRGPALRRAAGLVGELPPLRRWSCWCAIASLSIGLLCLDDLQHVLLLVV